MTASDAGGRLAVRFDVPNRLIAAAKQIAGIKEDDDTQVGDWELGPEQAMSLLF